MEGCAVLVVHDYYCLFDKTARVGGCAVLVVHNYCLFVLKHKPAFAPFVSPVYKTPAQPPNPSMPPRPYPPRRPFPPAYKTYTCFLGPLTLFVRETSQPNTFEVRVTHKPRARTFEQALIIHPGTVLCLHTKRGSRYVRARVFNPRIQYGRLVAGGVLIVDG